MSTITLGYQGEPGAFSEQAAKELLPEAEIRGYLNFDRLIEAVDSAELTYALLPVENSISGAIARSYDLLSSHERLHIIDETSLPIVQHLIGTATTRIEEVIEVRSHPVALDQCRNFLAHYPHWNRKVVEDTAGAVREIMEQGDPRFTAIASSFAANRYHAKIIASAIQDDAKNYTRFFLISRESRARRALDRACITLAFPSRVGSLRDALTRLAEAGLNLRSLTSRPARTGPFEYRFYCEIENGDRPTIEAALQAIEGDHRILGCY
jgi:prephenate dehydratase